MASLHRARSHRDSAAFAFAAALSVLGSGLVASAAPLRGTTPAECRTADDPARITAHLRRVEALLRARDVSDLPSELQQRRRAGLDALHAYVVAGRYPHNDDFAGRLVPYFIDDAGRACAVAHIVISSGHAELARAVARSQNNAHLREMRVPGLAEWIGSSGFTFDELALIQPEYCGGCETYEPCFVGTCAGSPGETWECVYGPLPDGHICWDLHDACHDPVSVCEAAECVLGPPLDCNDGDLCTQDACDLELGCVGTPIDCDDGDPCTSDKCNPWSGCRHAPVDCATPGGGCDVGGVAGGFSAFGSAVAVAAITAAARWRRARRAAATRLGDGR